MQPRALQIVFITLVTISASPAARKVDFQREVRPILSNNCFQCHGPDEKTRLAGLRLDTREGAFEQRKDGLVITPGNPKASLLIRRVTSANQALRMPPVHSKKTLTADQVGTLNRWIEQGADWKEHWAFQPPSRPKPPTNSNTAWARNAIDRFILARLEQAGLKPAPEADRNTLIRRLSLDLTGLPPSPEQVETFLEDSSPNAYEKLVDRLLASPHWGEHRGRYWLDAARYADTHGLHIDNYREMWPYRDWVIQAFQRNLPFDQFTIEQLAGDLLADRTLDQWIASGFHRCNITTNEGGAIPEEVDAMYQKDRVETTATVWLGLTAGCASCHDHKFDPISQKEFYQLVAFFNNTTQRPLDGNISDTPPVIVVPRAEDRERWSELQRQEQQALAQKKEIIRQSEPAFDQWLASGAHRAIHSAVEPAALRTVLGPSRTDISHLPDRVTWAEGPLSNGLALKFGPKASLEMPLAGAFHPSKPLTLAAWVYLPRSEEDVVVASYTDDRTRTGGWILDVAARVPKFALLDEQFPLKLQIRGSSVQRMREGAWSHLAVTYDGSGEIAGLSLFLNGKLLPVDRVAPDPDEEKKSADPARMKLRLATDGRRFFPNGAIADFHIYDRVLSREEVQILAEWKKTEAAMSSGQALSTASREILRLIYLNRHVPAYRELIGAFDHFDQQRREIRRRGAVTHVLAERPGSKPQARVLFRGMYDQPRDVVTPDVPSVLPPMPSEFPPNRLGLARWLVDPANPLTARVTVNRFWQEVFGAGLVRTSEDFGSQGEPPSHPALLDWLAVEFRESGWDVKKLFHLIVTSSTYRQSSAATPEKLKKDPENRLHSRGARYRMDAEMIRDLALASSGLLVPAIGGPSVKPYQPEGIWETVAMKNSNTRFYSQDKGDGLYRRSLYTFWKRSAPPASMEIFNAPSRENCTVRRERTNTPLQALVTLNDPQFVEAARRLAEMVLSPPQDDFNQQLDSLTLRVLARKFTLAERKLVRGSFDDFLAHFRARPPEARRLITTGASKVQSGLEETGLAAWTMVASQVLNLDEAVNR
jgi:hypothetical protein